MAGAGAVCMSDHQSYVCLLYNMYIQLQLIQLWQAEISFILAQCKGNMVDL